MTHPSKTVNKVYQKCNSSCRLKMNLIYIYLSMKLLIFKSFPPLWGETEGAVQSGEG